MFDSLTVSQQSYTCPALVFYKIDGKDEPWINVLAAWMTGAQGMAHVELRFSSGESISIYQNEQVFLKKRGYSNTQYQIVPLTAVGAQAEKKMYRFATAQVGKEFNTGGLRRAWLPTWLRRTTDGPTETGTWFCSELITKTLQEGGFFPTVDACGSSPNALFRAARTSRSGLGGVVGINSLALSERRNSIQFSNIVRPMIQNNGRTG